MPDVDTYNKFMVGFLDKTVVVLKGPGPRQPLSKADCLLLSAYLVIMCGATEDEFRAVLEAVQNT